MSTRAVWEAAPVVSSLAKRRHYQLVTTNPDRADDRLSRLALLYIPATRLQLAYLEPLPKDLRPEAPRRSMLVFGLAFQTPIAIFILNVTGLVSIDLLKKSRRFVFLGVFVIAAMVTPPDVISQIMLGALSKPFGQGLEQYKQGRDDKHIVCAEVKT